LLEGLDFWGSKNDPPEKVNNVMIMNIVCTVGEGYKEATYTNKYAFEEVGNF